MVHKNPGVLFQEKNLIPRINPPPWGRNKKTCRRDKDRQSNQQSKVQLRLNKKESQILKELGVGGSVFLAKA